MLSLEPRLSEELAGLGWAGPHFAGTGIITSGHRRFRSYLAVHAGAENRTGTHDRKEFPRGSHGLAIADLYLYLNNYSALYFESRTILNNSSSTIYTTYSKHRRGLSNAAVCLILFVRDLLYQKHPY